ncbi:MAG: glucokinase [Chromatiaceae bacterium]
MGVLVGDVGGTKTVLALAERVHGRLHLDRELRLPSGDFASLEDLVRHYLAETGLAPDRAAFAVAGPVRDGHSEITNLPWIIDSRRLGVAFGWRDVGLLNDLEAVAWGIPALGPEDLAVLHPGEEGAQGNACVIAAGTGLGQAGLFWDGQRHHPFATEGGHGDFAPATAQEEVLLGWLCQRYGHVSWERLVSGLGLRNIYEFLLSQEAQGPGGSLRSEAGEDLGAAIAAGAASGTCPLCVATMALFVRLYGREAGNLALKHMALGGVYLGGGIAPKNLDLLRGPDFLAAFLDKGRMAPLLRRMPVKVILNPHTPLFGAARFLDHQPG